MPSYSTWALWGREQARVIHALREPARPVAQVSSPSVTSRTIVFSLGGRGP